MREISPARQTRAVEALVDPRDWTCEWYEDVDGHSSGRTPDGQGSGPRRPTVQR